MKCKHCKNEIPSNSVFCMFCGTKTVKDKVKQVKVPAPIRKADGSYYGRVMVEGQRIPVNEPTEAQYFAVARALKEKTVAAPKGRSAFTLGEAIEKYITTNSAVLSVSTIRGYRILQRNRFKAYQDKNLSDIDWQQMINEETTKVSPKTVRNGWGLVKPSCAAVGFDLPKGVNLPTVPESDEPWLDPEQLTAFLKELKGTSIEFVALLALHSLRESEIIALNPSSVTKNGIKVRGAVVPDEHNKATYQEQNKTRKSTRNIPILIPRLLEVIPTADAWSIPAASNILADINRVCVRAGVPEVGCQGLRRTFASYAYYLGWSELMTMQVGGWSNTQTIHKFYVRLSQLGKNADYEKMKAKYKKIYKDINK